MHISDTFSDGDLVTGPGWTEFTPMGPSTNIYATIDENTPEHVQEQQSGPHWGTLLAVFALMMIGLWVALLSK